MLRTLTLLLALGLVAGCSKPPSAHQSAVDRAGAFIRGLRDERVRVDDFWLLTLTLRHRPDWASAAVFARTAEQRFPGDPYLRLLRRDHPPAGLTFTRVEPGTPEWPYRVPAPYEKMMYAPFDRVLLRALYCDVGTFDAQDVTLARQTTRGDGSYADTHALAALLLVIEQGRDPDGQAAAAVEELVPHLVTAQDQATVVDDLFAERIAFLYWAGHGKQVKTAWLDRLVEAQRPDGAWGSGSGQGHNLHATALATLALLYHEDGAARQRIYAP